MKFLVIGSGGREHAIVKALRQSSKVQSIHVAPGNAGMALEAVCHSHCQSIEHVVSLTRKTVFDCIVIGPEAPLADGLADRLREHKFVVFGPSQAAAQLEASKIFAKQFMLDAGVPTAPFEIVKSVSDVQSALKKFSVPFVLKADGLAAGKGVFICESEQDLIERARQIFDQKVLGDAGKVALLEQFQPGYELSYLILTDGHNYQPLPLAQDHKRLLDDDRGPNTGGMGVVAPLHLDSSLHQKIHEQILLPTVRALGQKKIDYRGVLFLGLMITANGPIVLEYNVRFGDPETQVLLPLLKGDWTEVFLSVANGQLPTLDWQNRCAACVVLAASGYPENPQKNVPIQGTFADVSPQSYFLHAGTSRQGDQFLVNGGRVLNAMGLGSTIEEAVSNAYAQAKSVSWPGLRMRTDIGKKITQNS